MTRIEEIEDLLKRISALAENPHWTMERRWRIAELSHTALRLVLEEKTERGD